jgi:hypothetical protein
MLYNATGVHVDVEGPEPLFPSLLFSMQKTAIHEMGAIITAPFFMNL